MKALCLGLFILFSQLTLEAVVPVDSLELNLNELESIEKVNALNDLFRHHFHNNPVLALSYARKALELAQELNYELGIATSLNDIGVIYRIRGQFDEALSKFVDAFRIYSKLNDREGIAKVLNNIGTIYSLKADYEKALENYLKSYAIFKKLDAPGRIVGILNNIGNVYKEKNEDQKALEYYQEALQLQKEIGHQEFTYDPLTNIGNIYFKKNQFDKALEAYFESLELERAQEDLYGQAYALSNIGITYYEKDEYKMAISFQHQALSLAKTIEDNVLLNNIYKALADAYFANDDLLEAYNALSLHLAVKDSLFNEESNRKINQLELEFEFLKKESELALEQKNEHIQELRSEKKQVMMLAIITAAILVVSILIGLYRNYIR